MNRFFLITTADQAKAFIERREDAVAAKDAIVVLTDRPLDGRDGMRGDIICAVDLKAGTSIRRYERKKRLGRQREWHVPVPVFLRMLKKINLV